MSGWPSLATRGQEIRTGHAPCHPPTDTRAAMDGRPDTHARTWRHGRRWNGRGWRVRDFKLGCEVAIKTLPEEFARDVSPQGPDRGIRCTKRTHALRVRIVMFLIRARGAAGARLRASCLSER